eukprot:gene3640-2575_t
MSVTIWLAVSDCLANKRPIEKYYGFTTKQILDARKNLNAGTALPLGRATNVVSRRAGQGAAERWRNEISDREKEWERNVHFPACYMFYGVGQRGTAALVAMDYLSELLLVERVSDRCRTAYCKKKAYIRHHIPFRVICYSSTMLVTLFIQWITGDSLDNIRVEHRSLGKLSDKEVGWGMLLFVGVRVDKMRTTHLKIQPKLKEKKRKNAVFTGRVGATFVFFGEDCKLGKESKKE